LQGQQGMMSRIDHIIFFDKIRGSGRWIS